MDLEEIGIEYVVQLVTHHGQWFNFMAYHDDAITHWMGGCRFHESDMLEVIWQRYGVGGIYVDFGAFIGTHSVFFSRICKADKVIAVEANREAAYFCEYNLFVNGCENVELYNLAVDEHPGQGKLIQGRINKGSANVVREPVEEDGQVVQIVRAGDFLQDGCKFLKVDVESLSIPAVLGCRPEIEKWKPIIAVEAAYPDQFFNLEFLMRDMGYKYQNTYGQTPMHIYEPV